MKNLGAGMRRMRQRLGAKQELFAGVVLAVLAAGGLSFTLITHTGTPAGAALAYMAAVDRADANYVWSHSVINTASATSADVSLVDKAALAAQLKATAHTRSGFVFQGLSFVSTGTQVTVTYKVADRLRSTSLLVRGGAPHSWPVVLAPVSLNLNLPPGAGQVAIDGREVNASGDQLKVAVLPGTHKFSLGASYIYLPFVGAFDAGSALPATSSIGFTNLKVTDQAAAESQTAVSKAIQSCAAATALRPAGCLQSYTSDTANTGATWSLLGDPLAGARVGVNANSALQVTGQYVMRLSYGSAITHGTRVIAVGGPYAATLKWDGRAISVSGFDPAPPAVSLPQPTATDAQIQAALKSQFDSCLRIQAGSAVGCPQQVAAFYASNFVWHANGDSLQSATVAWDATQGFYKVAGKYDFTVDYDSTPPYSPTRHYQGHSSGEYVADVYWDGSKAVFVGFEK